MHEALLHVLKKLTAESASGIMGAESGGGTRPPPVEGLAEDVSRKLG